ncbi:MAG: aminotransferase class I/II-fold pyridoxal phosphate-dependent enzyme, partial [Clostridia bacterium]
AAEFFGAEKTRFLVNGSSGGILSMVGAVCGEGDKIICDRFCHRSFISALVVSGAIPVWVYPETIENGEMWGGINPADIERAVRENPDAKAIYITSPNYFGLSSDVEEIARIAHEHKMPLLVDGAHGAHYGISPLLPPSAVSLGADMVVVSAHKTLPSVTQSAYLHINGSFSRLEAMLKMYQTSSPSYILMASLDYARAKMEEEGDKLWTDTAKAVLDIFPEQDKVIGGYAKYKDPCRIVLPMRGNPFKAAEKLRNDYGISVECSYGGGVVCIANTAHKREDMLKLGSAAEEINSSGKDEKKAAFTPVKSKAVLSPRQAFFSETEKVPISSAVGRICARDVLVYPPGVAQLMPGERISEGAAGEIIRIAELGGEVHGLTEGKIEVVR